MLITAALCILATSLLLTSGNVHAQTRTALAPQHVTMPANDGSTYPFTNWWGYGMCLSHGTLGWVEWAGQGAGIVYGMQQMEQAGVPASEAGVIAFVIGAASWALKPFDRGRGVCIERTWVQWMPFPLVWPQ